MANVKDFGNTSITVSEVNQATEQGQVIRELKKWNKDFETLRANSFCTIKVGADQRHGVRIFFGDINIESTFDVPDRHISIFYKRKALFVPLWVELNMVGCNYPVIDSQVTVSLDVHQLSESLISEKSFASGSVTFKLGASPQAAVIDAFLVNSYNNLDFKSVVSTQPEDLRFEIIATISPIHETLNLALESSEKRTSEAALIEQFTKMYKSDVNFPDLKLKTKDGRILSSHKFIVAARSSMFNEVIKMETEKEDFSGTIKVDVNAEAMAAILHWMYTGEVYDKVNVIVMEQVIEAGVRFDLPEMLKVLEKKMIIVCSKDNMFRLYEAAKKYGLLTAVDDVGSFIKSNV